MVGQVFYERCRRIISEAEEAELAVTHLQDIPRGTLKISAPLSFGMSHLADALPHFQLTHPELCIDIDFTDRRIDFPEEGYDVAVRIGHLEDSTLIARRIGSARRPILASKDYWKRHGKPSHPGDLSHHNCLTYSYLNVPMTWRFHNPASPKEALSVKVSGSLNANNGSALAHAAVAGLGVISIPDFITVEVDRDGVLETALEPYEPGALGIYALYPPNSHLSAKVRAFIDFLVDRFSGKLEHHPSR